MRNKSTIKIIATGGTIAGAGTSSTMTTGYQPGALSIDELLKEVPSLANVANIKVEQLFNIDSADMTTERLLTKLKIKNTTLKKPRIPYIIGPAC